MHEDPGGDEKVMVAVGRTNVVRLVVLVRRILSEALLVRNRVTLHAFKVLCNKVLCNTSSIPARKYRSLATLLYIAIWHREKKCGYGDRWLPDLDRSRDQTEKWIH